MINLLSISDWIAIVGLCISIILYQRVRKKKIIFLQKDHFHLNNADFSRFENLKMTFNDEDISDYLYFVSGTIILTGDEDVDISEINHPPCIITTDDNGKWKSQNILKKSDLLSCNLLVDHNTLKIETGELKSKDYIQFNGFYQAKKKGIKFRHRILNVSNEVEIISDDSATEKIVLSIILTFFTGLFLYFLIDMNREPKKEVVEKEKINYTQTVNLNIPTKEDSLRGKRHHYDDLYFIHGDSVKYDSIFKQNTSLNEKLNNNYHKNVEKVIDSVYKKRTDINSRVDKYLLELKYSKDSLFYVDHRFLYNITDSIFSNEITKSTKINPNKKFKINDTISISFILNDYYNEKKKIEEKKGFSFKNLGSIFIALITIFFIFVDFSVIYNLYLLKKYKKIISH